MKCKLYKSEILNDFYEELFSTDFRDYDSPTQNAKTDYLFDFDSFEKWFDYLIKSFVENTKLTLTKEDVESELKLYPIFVEQIRSEYQELLELCQDDEDDDEDDDE